MTWHIDVESMRRNAHVLTSPRLCAAGNVGNGKKLQNAQERDQVRFFLGRQDQAETGFVEVYDV